MSLARWKRFPWEPLSFRPLLTHPLCPDSKTLFQSRIGRVSSVDSNICPPKLSCEIHKPPQLWGHTFACSTRSESFAFATGTNWSTRQSTGCRRPWYPAIWGPCFPRPAVEAGEGFFFPELGGAPYGGDQRCCWVHGSALFPSTAVN